MITGSIFISNKLGSGIEIGGASSGFIKSVGYSGFTSIDCDGPGGFLIYSGSGNLVIGSDLMEGVGFEFVSANDTSHMKFTTSGSGELDIKEKFSLVHLVVNLLVVLVVQLKLVHLISTSTL